MIVSEHHLQQFQRDGYCVLENALPPDDVAGLRAECQRQLDEQQALMERAGATTLGLSHRQQRYFLSVWHQEQSFLERFLLGERMCGIVGALLGPDAYVFLELFVVKPAHTGSAFAWHQDSGYLLGRPHRPYLSLWCALDNITPTNGALSVLPLAQALQQPVLPHVKDKRSNDLVGYQGDEPGVVLPVPCGSIVAMASTVLHRSGPNTEDQPRRAYLASYSAEPITDRNGALWNQARPCLRGGQRVGALPAGEI